MVYRYDNHSIKADESKYYKGLQKLNSPIGFIVYFIGCWGNDTFFFLAILPNIFSLKG